MKRGQVVPFSYYEIEKQALKEVLLKVTVSFKNISVETL